jgi:15-cis-phytoene synthase/lycopene beta-cyclase
MLYATFHFYFTIPLCVFLGYIARPFYSNIQLFKLVLLSLLAVVYTTPWDSYLIRKGVWFYCKDCVYATIFHIPIEEYFFMLIQSTIMSFWLTLVFQSDTYITNISYTPQENSKTHGSSINSVMAKIFAALFLLGVVAIFFWSDQGLYLSLIIAWVSPVLSLQSFVAADFWACRWRRCCFAVIVPTLYMWLIDSIAISCGIWTIVRRYSTGIHVWPHLPLEEAMFFLYTNAMLTGGWLAIDRTLTLERHWIKLNERNWWKRVFLSTFLQQAVKELRSVCAQYKMVEHVICTQSSSFFISSLLFPQEERERLWILYGFCRVTDNVVDDDGIALTTRKRFISSMEDFVGGRDQYIEMKSHVLTIEQLTCIELFKVSFPGFCSSKDFVKELFMGYKWDLDNNEMASEADLFRYCEYVAGSVGQQCTYVLLENCFSDKTALEAKFHQVRRHSRDMGTLLQLVNIARDIVADALIGRCYIPSEWFEGGSIQKELFLNEIRTDFIQGESRIHGSHINQQLRVIVRRLRACSRPLLRSAKDGLLKLPKHLQRPLLSALYIYSGILDVICQDILDQQLDYPVRACLSRSRKLWTLVDVYFFQKFT